MNVADRLAREPTLSGFESATARSILGDMLLTTALENRRHAEGHSEQVQRCFPNHYLSSWIDLPISASHLRGVPEMIVALLNGQPKGDHIEPFRDYGRYRVGSRVQDNELLKVFAPGVTTEGARKSDIKSDIPRSRDNPEFLWIDDSEVVGDLIAVGAPVPGHVVAQEVQHRGAEVLEGAVALVVGGVPVHQPP